MGWLTYPSLHCASRAAQICMALAGKGAILNPKPPTAAPLSHAIVHSRDGMLVQKLW